MVAGRIGIDRYTYALPLPEVMTERLYGAATGNEIVSVTPSTIILNKRKLSSVPT